MTDSRELYIAKEAMNFDHAGETVFVDRGTVVRAGHPIMKGREGSFEPLHVHYEVPLAKAEEPEDDDDAPVSHVRADQRGARTR
jgi:hypothetical protein